MKLVKNFPFHARSLTHPGELQNSDHILPRSSSVVFSELLEIKVAASALEWSN